VIDLLLAPLTWAALLLVLHYLLRSWRPRLSVAAPAMAALVLVGFALPPVANALMRGLESTALTNVDYGAPYDAVVLLTGVMDGDPSIDTGESAYNESVERVTVTFELLRSGRARHVLITGSSWSPGPGEGDVESRRIARDLERWGIDASRIAVEEASRTTRENAVESARILGERRWMKVLLVTSAAHMQRARGAFAAVGIAVDTRPVDIESYDPARHQGSLFPSTRALGRSTMAIRERVGRIVYRLRGWTKE
jgi:uncharacterized SAM-binding protein YcdF (DUF218 family)